MNPEIDPRITDLRHLGPALVPTTLTWHAGHGGGGPRRHWSVALSAIMVGALLIGLLAIGVAVVTGQRPTTHRSPHARHPSSGPTHHGVSSGHLIARTDQWLGPAFGGGTWSLGAGRAHLGIPPGGEDGDRA